MLFYIRSITVALKIYCIQAVQAPRFDNLILLPGNFHIESAFFGAVGTYIADSGVEHLQNKVYWLKDH